MTSKKEIAEHKNYTDQNCKSPESWKEITPLPTEAFKNANKIISFPTKRISKTFLTSGTTSSSTGQHHFLDTSLYEKSILATWNKLKLLNCLICLTQSHECNNESSLIHMFKTLNGKYLINSSVKLISKR